MSKNQPSPRLKSFFKVGITGLKRLLKEDVGLIYTTLGGVGSTFLGAFFWFILASLVTVDNYGLANYYIAIASIFAGIATIGLNMTVTTYLAKGERKLLYEANSLTLVSGIVSALVLSVFHWETAGFIPRVPHIFPAATARLNLRWSWPRYRPPAP